MLRQRYAQFHWAQPLRIKGDGLDRRGVFRQARELVHGPQAHSWLAVPREVLGWAGALGENRATSTSEIQDT